MKGFWDIAGKPCHVVLIFFVLLLFAENPLFSAGADIPASASYVSWESLTGTPETFFRSITRGKFFDGRADNPFMEYFAPSGQREARYPRTHDAVALTFAGIPVNEVIVRFSLRDESLSSVYFSVYNRGDADPVSKNAFFRMIQVLDGSMRTLSGAEGELQKDYLARLPVYRKVWIDAKKYLAYVLLWSYEDRSNRFTGEFIQLDIMRFDPTSDPRKRPLDRLMPDEKPRAKDLLQNIVRNQAGDVYIRNVPMVDQGSKGYCAVAVAERVLRYFGVMDASQHRLAQMTGADPEQGTSAQAMTSAFEKIGARYGVRMNEEYLRYRTVRDVKRLVDDYNKAAKKTKSPKGTLLGRNGELDLNATLISLDPALLRSVLSSRSLEDKKFLRVIQDSIGKGIPVVWCVTLGMVPEEKLPQGMTGGHMRLIVGFNAQQKQIIYSDTWGAGHELKIMNQDDAFLITTALYRIEPRKK